MRNLFKKSERYRGFTLVETLVAVSVLLISIVGPLSTVSRSLMASRFSKDQVTAFYLAQEAVELVRNKRDNNILNSLSWDNGFSICESNSTGCKVSATDRTFSSCSISGCQILNHNANSGLYSYSSGDKKTAFTRIIKITSKTADEINITANIAWNTGVLGNNFIISENLLNWQ